MSSDVRQQGGANEAVFREINEAIKRGQWPGDEALSVTFRCECARLGCTEMLDLALAEYESVRDNPRRFIVATGHERPEAERVVARPPGYVIVEKRDQAATPAQVTDPRR